MGVKISISSQKTLQEEIVEAIESAVEISGIPIQMIGDINNMTVDVDIEDLTADQETAIKQALAVVFEKQGKEIASIAMDIPARKTETVVISSEK